jgi:GUN4-like
VKDKPSLVDLVPKAPITTLGENMLSSEKYIDYSLLRDLLKEGNWKKADEETLRVMLRVVNRGEQDDISISEISAENFRNFPCAELKTIDSLWVKYSNGKFGFSVQKKIYVECGAMLDGIPPNYEIWKEFSDRIGWAVSWGVSGIKRDISYDEVTYDMSAPKGHLPIAIWLVHPFSGVEGFRNYLGIFRGEGEGFPSQSRSIGDNISGVYMVGNWDNEYLSPNEIDEKIRAWSGFWVLFSRLQTCEV